MAAAIWDRGLWLIAGAAVGGAAQDALAPILEPARQNAWSRRPYKVLDPKTAAALRAREAVKDYGGIDLRNIGLEDDARRNGIGSARFAVETALARTFPSSGQLLELRRRELARDDRLGISQDNFRDWLRRQGLPTEAIDAVGHLLTRYVELEMIATSVQRGIMPNVANPNTGERLLPVGPPSETGRIEPMPEAGVDPLAEAQAHGFDFHRLAAATRIVGLPPGPGELLQLLNRDVIDDADFFRGIAEGNTRNEWGKALYQLRHALLPPSVLVNLVLRGWYDEDQIAPRMELHGYNKTQLHDWFLASGRPAAPVQMFTAWARGVDGPAGVPMNETQFLKGVRESDIRPEWGPMLWGIRHAYPSLFQLRRAVQDGSITPARAKVILRYERYEDVDANALVASWTSTSTGEQAGSTKTTIVREYESRIIGLATATRLLRDLGMSDEAIAAELALADYRVVRSSLTAAATKTRTLYVGWRIDRVAASNELDALGIPAAARDQSLAEWDHVRELNRPDLTPAQIATAAQRGIWTAQQSYDELLSRGYSDRDARVLLRLHKVTGP